MNSKQQSAEKRYRIRVKGHLDQKWSEWFMDLELTCEDGNTVLTGAVQDRPSLHGLLTKIRDLNLPLLSVEQLERNDQIS
ncbi:MAG: hypothetical protein GWP61_03100 [Chloroflexi bacterium]|jgi:hypothetical protein|nr:hypothetical protein [Chloroflexota bacterium]